MASPLPVSTGNGIVNANARSIETTLEEEGLGRQLNVLSLLAQSLYAVKRGDDRRALLFFGVALLALKSGKASLLLQGAIQANGLRERLMQLR